MTNHIFILKLEKKLDMCPTPLILLMVESPDWLEMSKTKRKTIQAQHVIQNDA